MPKNFKALLSIDEDRKDLDYFRLRDPKRSCVNEEIPVTLVSKAFGTFQYELRNSKDAAIPLLFNSALKLSRAVSTMSYTAESMMVNVVKDILTDIFSPHGNYNVVSLGSTHITDITLCLNGKALCNFEMKLHLAGNTSDPNLENICYLHYGHLGTNKVFLVSLVGSEYLQVFGAVRLRHDKTIIAPICNPVSLQYLSPQTDHFLGVVPNLATVLYALQKGIEELDNEGTAALPLPLPEVLVTCSQCNFEMKIIINYENRIDQHILLFIGNRECNCNLNSNGKVVVKFVQGIYGEKAHRILATEKLAPKLFGIVKVNPIWTAVVMEHIVGCNLEHLLDDKVVKKEKVITGINKILTVLKRDRIVHGDLLPHNFMITTSDDDDDYCVRVVDFDWAGDEGSVKYPVYINMELQWPTGVGAGCQITHQHDAYLLNKLIQSV